MALTSEKYVYICTNKLEIMDICMGKHAMNKYL